MQCVTPMFRLYDINTRETKRILSRKEVMEGLALNPNNIRHQLGKMNRFYLAKNQQIQLIPCNHCWACNLNYSAEWATKNMLESLDHEYCYFITLTYDEEHLPIAETLNYKEKYTENGETKERIITVENDGTWTTGTLWPPHLDKLFHDIRQKGNKIRYFYCGEYGSPENTTRPHYHILLYGLNLELSQDVYDISQNKEDLTLHWKNKLLDELWEYGIHDITDLSWSDAAYVSRYCTKKLNKEPKSEKWYAENGRIKEFVRMSRRPGIGRRYYDKHKLDIYKNDEMIMKTIHGNTGNFKPPKSFDRLFKEEYPEEFEKIQKHRRECAERVRKNNYHLADYTDLENLLHKAEDIAIKANMLKREI